MHTTYLTPLWAPELPVPYVGCIIGPLLWWADFGGWSGRCGWPLVCWLPGPALCGGKLLATSWWARSCVLADASLVVLTGSCHSRLQWSWG